MMYCCIECDKFKPYAKRWKGMFLCIDCGNKRCPKATNHNNLCSNSNEPGQFGSVYDNSVAQAELNASRLENMVKNTMKKTMTNPQLIEFKLTHKNAKVPQEKRDGDVGFDVYAVERTVLKPGETVKVETGLQLANMPKRINNFNVFLKVEGRSGMALKGIFPVGGIIDPTYRGDIGIILTNTSALPYVVTEGDRVAQLIVYSVCAAPFVKMTETDVVKETNRGSQGFGSSGK